MPSHVRTRLAACLHRSLGTRISGEDLAAELGITRSAVAKHVAVLREGGFEIDAAPRLGYLVLRWPDLLSREAIAPLIQSETVGQELVCLAECDSTNRVAFERAVAGAATGTTVVADAQTAGRGRRGRQWHSPPGTGIYLSAVLRPALPPSAAPPLTLTCAVAVAEAVHDLSSARPGLKWPNDLLLDGRKLAGILLEMSAEPERVEFVVAGIGINVNTTAFPDELSESATSLRLATGEPVSRPHLVAAILAKLEIWTDRLVTGGFEPARARWSELAAHLGRTVRVDGPDGRVTGLAESIDTDGALILLREGQRERIVAGDVWDPEGTFFVGGPT